MDIAGQRLFCCCFFFSLQKLIISTIFSAPVRTKWQNTEISPCIENLQDCSLLNRLRLLSMITPAKIFHLNDLSDNCLGHPKQRKPACKLMCTVVTAIWLQVTALQRLYLTYCLYSIRVVIIWGKKQNNNKKTPSKRRENE